MRGLAARLSDRRCNRCYDSIPATTKAELHHHLRQQFILGAKDVIRFNPIDQHDKLTPCVLCDRLEASKRRTRAVPMRIRQSWDVFLGRLGLRTRRYSIRWTIFSVRVSDRVLVSSDYFLNCLFLVVEPLRRPYSVEPPAETLKVFLPQSVAVARAL